VKSFAAAAAPFLFELPVLSLEKTHFRGAEVTPQLTDSPGILREIRL
jgi:hypothetical protein